MRVMCERGPSNGSLWVDLCSGTLPVDEARRWVTLPRTGGVVVFTGVVRDHSQGREGVHALSYEAWEARARSRLADVGEAALRRWSDLGRVALLHRLGDVALGEPTVVVAVSSPHRAEAFDAARFCIDTLKETVPIWKREHWDGGADWAACDHDLQSGVTSPGAPGG